MGACLDKKGGDACRDAEEYVNLAKQLTLASLENLVTPRKSVAPGLVR